jgi:transposase
MRLYGAPKTLERRRRRASALLAQGLSAREVARTVQASVGAVVVSSPCQNGGIICFREPDILNAGEVESGATEHQSAHNVAIEVLVAQQTQHRLFTAASLACQQALPEVCEVSLMGLKALANLLRSLLAFTEIGFYLVAMA